MAKTGAVGGKLAPKKSKTYLISYLDPKKLPKELGPCIDLFVAAYRERKAREQKVNDIKRVEDQIEEHIIALFKGEEINGVKGAQGSVTLKEKDVPKITDFDALCKFIKKNDAWDLLQRRPGEAACQARWEAGEEVPGVEKFHVKKLSLSEAK